MLTWTQKTALALSVHITDKASSARSDVMPTSDVRCVLLSLWKPVETLLAWVK